MRKKRLKIGWSPLVALVGALVPVVALAPCRPLASGPHTVAALAQQCRETGATGRALADEAVKAVARAFPYYSLWHLWEPPERALSSHRGWSHQYNTVLLLVLRELGFKTRLVHAAMVRGFQNPWWLRGHTWAKVTVGGYELDACASDETNRVGAVNFVPLTRELPLRRVTRWALGAWMGSFVAIAVWHAWLTGREVAPWVYGRKGRRGSASAG
ncbi:hypothetical protein [Tessaracoccus sp. MC1756]|uniref:hypothetical protein n=1 Tax=Tessaracoccus sp. MC1756 TaxID=2760311 RepID=UPI0016005E8F|nr:hypothetical protein [Tessaracoccus sp. MC1756]MBB1508779.1 hypothetical protein [Tessaracoccus sp. MC1756]